MSGAAAGPEMNLDWLGQGFEPLPQYLTALAIGLLIGLERERNPTAKAGLRTCALVALAGAISAALAAAFDAPALLAVGAAAVALMVIAAYYRHHEEVLERDPGTTTVAAVIVCYLLGALALAGHARLAVILAILATVLLYFKAELGGAVRSLERRDVKRTVHPTNPPQVEYAITPRGRAFEPVFRAMEQAATQLFPPPEAPPAVAHAALKSPGPRQVV